MTIIMYPTAARLTLTIIEKVKSSGLRLITLIDAAPTAGRLLQHAQFQQLRDVAQRGIGRALGNGRPLAADEFPLETVE